MQPGFRRALLSCGGLLLLGSTGLARADDPAPTVSAADQLLAIAKSSVVDYKIAVGSDPPRPLQLLSDPIIRFTTDAIDEGGIYIWTDAGRPAVAAQVFRLETGNEGFLWLHEFQSLSADPIQLTLRDEGLWTPQAAGLVWQALPNDQPPAAGRSQRLSQMKQLARRFSANEQTPGAGTTENLTNVVLEIKPREAFRYESPIHGTIDGAAFWFAQIGKSDPELLLHIEACDGPEGRFWRFAAAPLTCWPVQLDLDERRVVDIPNRYLKSTPQEPYHIWRWQE